MRGPQRLLHRRNGSDPPTNNRAAADQPWCQQPAFVWRIRPTSKLTVSRDRTCALRNPRNCSRLVRQSYFASFAKAIELPWKPWGDFHRTAGTACQRQVKRTGSRREPPNRSFAHLGRRGRDHTGERLGSALAREPQWHLLTLPRSMSVSRQRRRRAFRRHPMRLIEPQASQRLRLRRQRRWPKPNNGCAAKAPSRK